MDAVERARRSRLVIADQIKQYGAECDFQDPGGKLPGELNE